VSGNECAEWRFESLVPFVLKDAPLDMSEMLLSISVTIYHVLKLENSNKWKSRNMSSINLVLISFIDYLDTCVCVYCLLLHSHLTRYTRRHGGVLPARASRGCRQKSKSFRITSNTTGDTGNKQIHEDLGIPIFAVYVMALTDSCNRCG